MKGIAGFYYVRVVESGIYECRAKGIFRKEGLKPLVGDDVVIEVLDEQEKKGNVIDLLPRRSELARPPVANADQALILFALHSPVPNYVLLDRFLISADMRGIPCAVAFNKIDTAKPGEIEAIRNAYAPSGHPLMFISLQERDGIEAVKDYLKGRTTVLAGPSGVGKSTLTNAMAGSDRMETGEISRKLARGKNTTRHSELIAIGENTFICDTPGFSALDTAGIEKEELQNYYDEFLPYRGKCRFDGCVHISEPDCAVKEARDAGLISALRYENYRTNFEELKEAERRRY